MPSSKARPTSARASSSWRRRPAPARPSTQIHCFNFPATLSHGKLTGDIPAISEGADRLARGIVRSLFVADRERHFAALKAFETPELLGDEWTDADATTGGPRAAI